MPILCSTEPVDTPFLGPIDPSSFTINFGTRNKLIPLVPGGESVALAITK